MREGFLNTKRLRFSVWRKTDIPDDMELWGNPVVIKFIVADGKMTEDQVQQRLNKEIETYTNYSIQYWHIFLTGTEENIGCCGLRPYDSKSNIVEMGIHLKEKYWGKGFAKEACLAVIDYGFENIKVNAIFTGHNPKNLSSARLLEKLGFRYTHDEFYPPTGLYHPSYLMTKEEYKITKAEYNSYK